MNYKIRITAENQAIVKRIADENGMNPKEFLFTEFDLYYLIVENKFWTNDYESDYPEITTEQFMELFDKKESLVGRWFEALEDDAQCSQVIKNNFYQICRESDKAIYFKVPHYEDVTLAFGIGKEYENKYFKLMPKDFQPTQEAELDKWLRETKAKNFTLEELKIYITNKSSCNDDLYKKLRIKLDMKGGISLADFLFNQWNNPTEESQKVETKWQPKRGDRVLVWDNDDLQQQNERIFVGEIKGEKKPIIAVMLGYEVLFLSGEKFCTCKYEHMKPLPIQQPKETAFKSKAIELIEGKINATTKALETIIEIQKDLLKQIKEL